MTILRKLRWQNDREEVNRADKKRGRNQEETMGENHVCLKKSESKIKG